MGLEPHWGVVIGLGIGGLIKVLFFPGGRRRKKALRAGACPTCGAGLIDKPFTTVTLRVCPQKHGYLSGDNRWFEAEALKRQTRGYRDAALEDLPQEAIIYWTMYHVLFGPGPVDPTPVDNVPLRSTRAAEKG